MKVRESAAILFYMGFWRIFSCSESRFQYTYFIEGFTSVSHPHGTSAVITTSRYRDPDY